MKKMTLSKAKFYAKQILNYENELSNAQNKEKISDIDIKERLLTLTNDETIFASRQGIKKVL